MKLRTCSATDEVNDMIIKLIQTQRSDPLYQKVRDTHYIANRQMMGRQIHYLIYIDNIFSGIISGSSPISYAKKYDLVFGVHNVDYRINEIVDNSVFALINNVHNAGSAVLSEWRYRTFIDWKEKYGYEIKGYVTKCFGDNREGTIYKADNWTHLGLSSGIAFATLGTSDPIQAKKNAEKLIAEYPSQFFSIRDIELNRRFTKNKKDNTYIAHFNAPKKHMYAKKLTQKEKNKYIVWSNDYLSPVV